MKPLLIHIHVYYQHLWPELRDRVLYLSGLGVRFHLAVTSVEECPQLEAEVQRLFPGAELLVVPNLGYDIAPFMAVLQSVNLEEFSYVIKLHTKRDVEQAVVCLCAASPFNIRGSRWRDALLAFSKPGNFERCLQELAQNPRCGMVAHHLTICPRVTKKDKEQYHTWLRAVELVQQMALPAPPSQHFVMGSMFMCRAELLKPLQGLNLKPGDFPPPDPEHLEETLAHVLERCLGAVVTAQGYEIRDCFSPRSDYVRELFWVALQRVGHFLYSRKVTRKGKLLVKICKIPVFYTNARGK